MKTYPHVQLTEKIIGAAIAVHRELGPGFLESIYENALKHELQKMSLSIEQQKIVPVYYDNVKVGDHRLDLIVEGCVLLELKATDGINSIFVSQLVSSLKATKLEVGLIINFNESLLKNGIKRIVLSNTGEKAVF
jgi:GxxExxY protein